jgi:hypothetical protein
MHFCDDATTDEADATRTRLTTRAVVGSGRVGARRAARRRRIAKRMAVSASQTTLLDCTPPRTQEQEEIRAMLGIPRPTTREQCLQEARPCPWVGCRDHLLLEVVRSPERTSLVLNKKGRARRRRLSPSAAAAVVRRWMDEAVHHLMVMPETCARDVARRGGVSTRMVGRYLGTTKEQARTEVIAARAKALEGARAARLGDGERDET